MRCVWVGTRFSGRLSHPTSHPTFQANSTSDAFSPEMTFCQPCKESIVLALTVTTSRVMPSYHLPQWTTSSKLLRSGFLIGRSGLSAGQPSAMR